MKLAAKGGQEISLELNKIEAIAASDTVNVTTIGALIHCNKSGNYNLLLSGMETPAVVYLNAGISYPLRIKRLFSTSTDHADGLVALVSVTATDDKA